MRRNTMTIKVKNRELIAALKEIPEPDLEFIVDAALSAAFRTVWFRSLMRQRGVDFKPPKGPGPNRMRQSGRKGPSMTFLAIYDADFI